MDRALMDERPLRRHLLTPGEPHARTCHRSQRLHRLGDDPLLERAGHEVVGLDFDLFAACTFGDVPSEIESVRKDVREVEAEDSLASMRCCIWRRCATTRSAI